MERFLLTKRGRALYPVFGQVEGRPGVPTVYETGVAAFTRVSGRNRDDRHNLLKLWRSGQALGDGSRRHGLPRVGP